MDVSFQEEELWVSLKDEERTFKGVREIFQLLENSLVNDGLEEILYPLSLHPHSLGKNEIPDLELLFLYFCFQGVESSQDLPLSRINDYNGLLIGLLLYHSILLSGFLYTPSENSITMKIPLVLFLVLLASLPSVVGLSPPEVTFIPPQISEGGAFLAFVDNYPEESVRVTWFVGGVEGGFGLFPKLGDKHVCFFSNSDPSATCGPTPFPQSTIGFNPYTFQVDSINQFNDKGNATLPVEVGGITMSSDITVENNTVFIEVAPGGPLAASVSYAVFYQNNLSEVTLGFVELTKNVQTGHWLGSVDLQGGEYYLALSATSDGNFGGAVARVSIPLPPPELSCPAPPGVGGDYDLEAEVVLSGVLIGPNDLYKQEGFTLTNVGDQIVSSLSVVVPADFSSILTVELDTTVLAPNDTMFFTITLQNIDSSLTINTVVDILSGLEVVGQIPVFIPVTVIGDAPVSCPSGVFNIEPNTWSGNFLLGQVSNTFTLTNTGDTVLTGINFLTTGTIGDDATVSLPSSVPPTGTGTIEISLDPFSSGNYQGSVIIQTDAGSEIILINVNFFDDLSFPLDSLESDFEDLKASLTPEQLLLLSDTIDNIDAALSSAESDTSFGNYKEAENSFVEAQAQIAALSALSTFQPSLPITPTGEGGDITSIVLVVIVLVVVVTAVFLIKKRRGKGEGIEDELEEELEEAMT